MATLFVADELLRLAKEACKRSESDPSEAIVAVVLSAVSIEAFLNDMVEFASAYSDMDGEPEEVAAFASILKDLESQRAQIRLRVQIGYYIFEKKKLNKGELPYQDFHLLMDLRNALVHKKPEKWTWSGDDQEYEPHRLVKRLADRKVIRQAPSDKPPEFFFLVCSSAVARWSYNVAVDMVQFLADCVPPSQLKKALASYVSLETI